MKISSPYDKYFSKNNKNAIIRQVPIHIIRKLKDSNNLNVYMPNLT